MKDTTVQLTVEGSDVSQNFTIEHAERLLSLQNNGGWKLPEDSKYTLEKNNELRLKQNKVNTPAAVEKSNT